MTCGICKFNIKRLMSGRGGIISEKSNKAIPSQLIPMHRNMGLLMITSIMKPKISSDYVFVLKTMQLEEILKNNNIKTDTVLVYWKPKVIGSILEAHYWLPNKSNPFNRLYIRAGVVLKKGYSECKGRNVE